MADNKPGISTEGLWRQKVDGGDPLIAISIYFFGFLIIAAFGASLAEIEPAVRFLVLLAATGLVSLVAVSACLLAPTPSTLSSLGLGRVSGRWLLLGVAGGLLLPLVTVAFLVLYTLLAGETPPSRIGEEAQTAAASELGSAILLVALVGFVAPFAEELLFRGILYTYFRRFGLVIALVVSSLLFGLIHSSVLLLPLFASSGVIFAFIRAERLPVAGSGGPRYE